MREPFSPHLRHDSGLDTKFFEVGEGVDYPSLSDLLEVRVCSRSVDFLARLFGAYPIQLYRGLMPDSIKQAPGIGKDGTASILAHRTIQHHTRAVKEWPLVVHPESDVSTHPGRCVNFLESGKGLAFDHCGRALINFLVACDLAVV